MYARFIRLILRRPWFVIAGVASLTVYFAAQIPGIRVETDINKFIPPDDDAVINQRFMDEEFGLQNLVMIAVERNDVPEGIYNPGTLAVIAKITDWLKTRPEFETSLNSDLRSLSTANNIVADQDGLTVRPFMEFPPKSLAEAATIKNALEHNSIFYGTLASKNGKAAMILVRESQQGHDDRGAMFFAVQNYVNSLRAEGSPEHFYIGGLPVVEGVFEIYIPGEAKRMLPAVVIMIAVFLYIAFRTLRGVLIPITILFATEMWMLGIHALMGKAFYTVSSIMPVLIVAIAVADSIHLLSRYYDVQAESPTAGRQEVLELTMREMGVPVLMTSVTTAVGFLSMYTTRIPPLQEFGSSISVGILAAFALTVVLIPAFLAVLPLRQSKMRHDRTGAALGVLHDFLVGSARWVLANPAKTTGLFVLCVALGGVGLTRLDTNSALVEQFKPGHFLRHADTMVNKYFPGTAILDVLLEGKDNDTFKNPELLRRIDQFQADMEQDPRIGDTFSIAEMIKRMNRMMHGDDTAYESIPDNRDLVAQYLLLYSISGDPGDFDDIVDYNYRHARIMIYLKHPGSHLAHETEKRAKAFAAPLFSGPGIPPVHVRLAGEAYRMSHTETHVIRGQIASLLVCLPAMMLLNWLMLRSTLMALLSILPVSMTVVIIYGSMGFIGIPLEIPTVLLGGMSIGIGVDFAIHYLFRYRLSRHEGRNHADACEQTAATAGRALLFNAVVLFFGFIVLLAARFNPQIKLGGLVAATVLICYVSTIYLFPVLLGRMKVEQFAAEREEPRSRLAEQAP